MSGAQNRFVQCFLLSDSMMIPYLSIYNICLYVISFYLSLYQTICLSMYVSLSLSLPVSTSLSVYRCLTYFLFSLPLSLSPSVSLSRWLAHSPSLSQSLPHFFQSLSHSIYLSYLYLPLPIYLSLFIYFSSLPLSLFVPPSYLLSWCQLWIRFQEDLGPVKWFLFLKAVMTRNHRPWV